MARLGAAVLEGPERARRAGGNRPSIWSAIHPRLLELIRAHRSTLIFVNSRRLAERLAGALNELAGETLVRSHHGSIARPQRVEVEELLKAGALRALVATSSLELGIDMGAIDLVVQIEAPPSVASGLQRIGRGGHQANAVSEGVIFPKFRGDLVACAAVARAMHDGAVEATRYPRNPLDIVAQQIVAMASMDDWDVDELFAPIRRAAPFAELSRAVFDGVLDMLSGRYPSDEFAELRPRITWDRVDRRRSRRATAPSASPSPTAARFRTAASIGVFLVGAGARRGARRRARRGDGVREPRRRDVRARRLVVAHRGDHARSRARVARARRAGQDAVLERRSRRPAARARARDRPPDARSAAAAAGRGHRSADARARSRRARRREPARSTCAISWRPPAPSPTPKTIVIERVRDELGDWRVCVLSPRGGRVHAPWAMAVAAKIREETGIDVETLWGDDGFVVRFPDVDQPPDPRLLLPDPDEVQALVVRQLGATALFAAKFRENAARSLLLPKRRPGLRAPLWQQRKRAADLLAVASRYGSFPVLLETYRECLRDFFDMPALDRDARRRPQPDDPRRDGRLRDAVAVRRLAALQLRRELPLRRRRAAGRAPRAGAGGRSVAAARAARRRRAARAARRRVDGRDRAPAPAARSAVPREERRRRARHAAVARRSRARPRCASARLALDVAASVNDARRGRAACSAVRIAGEPRFIAVEDAARFRDALGVPLPAGIPEALLEPVRDPLGDLALRYARTHAPFTAADFAARYGLGAAAAEARADAAHRRGTAGRRRVPPGRHAARVDRRRRPAHAAPPLARQAAPRGRTGRSGRARPLRDDVAGHRQAAARRRRAARRGRAAAGRAAAGVDPRDGDPAGAHRRLRSRGSRRGDRGGRSRLGRRRAARRTRRPRRAVSRGSPAAAAAARRSGGLRRSSRATRDSRDRSTPCASAARRSSAPLHEAVGGGYPARDGRRPVEPGLARAGHQRHVSRAARVHPRARAAPAKGRRPEARRSARGAGAAVGEGDGRSCAARRVAEAPTGPLFAGAAPTANDARRDDKWAAAITQQLLARHGVVTREAVAAEAIAGGFGLVYPVLKGMEENGRIRRGYFVAGLGATQFALPGALDLLRSLRDAPDEIEIAMLAATDPANPYGATLKWPPRRLTAVGTSGPRRTRTRAAAYPGDADPRERSARR